MSYQVPTYSFKLLAIIGVDFLQLKWYPDEPERAGMLMSLPDIVSAVGSPLFGFILDRVAHNHIDTSEKKYLFRLRSAYLPFSAMILIIVHTLLGFTHFNPIFSLLLLGIAYSIFGAALWPLVAHFITDSNMLGTAYGIMSVALNLSLTFVPLIVARLLSLYSYMVVQVWFLSLSCLAFCLCVALVCVDYRMECREMAHRQIREAACNRIISLKFTSETSGTTSYESTQVDKDSEKNTRFPARQFYENPKE